MVVRPLRPIAVGMLSIVVCPVVLPAQSVSIRSVDFWQLEYPWLPTGGVPSDMVWCGLKAPGTVQITAGEAFFPSETRLVLDYIRYGDFTGDGVEDAAVVMSYHTGGTAWWRYAYFFTAGDDGPRLLAWLRAGSRADGGLLALTIEDPELVAEFADDSQGRWGDCCAAGAKIIRYHWTGTEFEQVSESARYFPEPSESGYQPDLHTQERAEVRQVPACQKNAGCYALDEVGGTLCLPLPEGVVAGGVHPPDWRDVTARSFLIRDPEDRITMVQAAGRDWTDDAARIVNDSGHDGSPHAFADIRETTASGKRTRKLGRRNESVWYHDLAPHYAEVFDQAIDGACVRQR